MLKAKQEQFCQQYIKDFNATQAASRAGYSLKTAYSIGSELLKKPEIIARIQELLEKAKMSGDQAEKLVSDIAQSSINDYLVPKMVEYTPKITKTIKDLIKDLRDEMDFEEQFSKEANYTTDEMAEHIKEQAYRVRQLARLKLIGKRKPGYTKIVYGEPVLIERMELDLVKLSKDKERGRIKSISYTEFGPKVELFAADGALRDVLKIHGKYAPDKIANTNTKGQDITPTQPITMIVSNKEGFDIKESE